MEQHITIVNVPENSDGKLFELVMNGEKDQAVGYLRHYENEW